MICRLLTYPCPKRVKLLNGMKPMLAVLVNPKRAAEAIGKTQHRFAIGQLVMPCIKNCGRTVPFKDRMMLCIFIIFPRQRLPIACTNLLFGLQPLGTHRCRFHHFFDERGHIQNGGDKQAFFKAIFGKRQKRKICAYADCAEQHMLPALFCKPQNVLQLGHYIPRHRLLRTVFACAVFRKVDAQHLYSLRTYYLRKAFGFFLITAFSVDKQINPVRFLAI